LFSLDKKIITKGQIQGINCNDKARYIACKAFFTL
jgi:hypothetical protein